MREEDLTEQTVQSYQAIYRELCNSYRAIDEFRTKLLGLLPLATGTGIFILMMGKEEFDFVKHYLMYIGTFGFFITLGLSFYELYGIKKCTSLIDEGIRLEKILGNEVGQFTSRPCGVLGFINEPSAASIIYPAVMAAWVFIAYFDDINPECAKFNAYGTFVIGFIILFGYNIFLVRDDIREFWNKKRGKDKGKNK